jgi:hypothetical protein
MKRCQDALNLKGALKTSDALPRHLGFEGLINNFIRASSGVLSAFFKLQGMQAVTMLAQSVRPPRDRGRTC